MKDENLYRTFGIVLLFFIMVCTLIAVTGLRMIDEYIESRNPRRVEQVKTTPILSMPTPSKGYFVECMNDDVAWVFHNDLLYYCTCEVGKWVYKEAPYDKDYRNFKFPNPQRNDTGAL